MDWSPYSERENGESAQISSKEKHEKSNEKVLLQMQEASCRKKTQNQGSLCDKRVSL